MAEKTLSGKVVVITGASSGFGKGAARKFAEDGATLVLAARRIDVLEELVCECRSLGAKALALAADVSDALDVDRLAKTAIFEFGRIDVWVNNAGVGAVGRFEEMPLADHLQVIKTDLLGTVCGSYLALRQFRKQSSGTLINIASGLGKLPAPYFASYVAAKFGVVGLSAALRQEIRENKVQNVHVCTVLPMSMDTPFFEHAANYTGHVTVPIPPTYDPQEVIDVIVRLATRPEDEVIVGMAGKLAVAAHGVMPGLTEYFMGKQVQREQIEKAPPAPVTEGSVHQAVVAGRDVTGGWRDGK